MRITKQTRREAKELFRRCQVNGLLDTQRVHSAVDQVLQRKPRGYFALLHHFCRLVRLEMVKRTARVESAIPLSPELQTAVRANLGRSYGDGVMVEFVDEPGLVGGMRVRVGSDVYDGSIQGRLTALEESF
jgi:F-type H+-transporting ATPase subunit delta